MSRLPDFVRLSLAAALLMPAMGYLIAKAFFDTSDTIDFKYIWLAGHLWLDGQNPYLDVYLKTGRELFVGLNPPAGWFYPPSWWPIASLMSTLPYELSGAVWRALSALCLVAGSTILFYVSRRSLGNVPFWLMALVAAFGATMSATALTLSLGQTSLLIFLGVALFAAAYLSQGRIMMAIALVVLLLKPNIGLVFLAFALASSYWWRSVAAAVAVSLLMALPALVPLGFLDVLGDYLLVLGTYGEDAVTQPVAMTGLRNLVYFFSNVEVSGVLMALAGVPVAMWLGAQGDRRADAAGRADLLCLLILASVLFVPLHTYDLIMVLPLLVLSARWPVLWQLGLWFGFLVIFRVNNLALELGLDVAGERWSPGSFVASVVMLGMFLLSAAYAASTRRRLVGCA